MTQIEYYRAFKDEGKTYVSSKVVSVSIESDNPLDIFKECIYVMDNHRNKGARLEIDFKQSDMDVIRLVWVGSNVEHGGL